MRLNFVFFTDSVSELYRQRMYMALGRPKKTNQQDLKLNRTHQLSVYSDEVNLLGQKCKLFEGKYRGFVSC